MDDLDIEPTIEELSKAITEIHSWKAPGSNRIPTDLFRQCLRPLLHNTLVKCWKESKVPQDMRDIKIITFYKNKGARSDCNNYRGISLLGIADKAFRRVILPAYRNWSKEYIPSRNVDLDFNDPPLTRSCLCGNCKRNAKNRTCLCTSLSLTLLKLSSSK